MYIMSSFLYYSWDGRATCLEQPLCIEEPALDPQVHRAAVKGVGSVADNDMQVEQTKVEHASKRRAAPGDERRQQRRESSGWTAASPRLDEK